MATLLADLALYGLAILLQQEVLNGPRHVVGKALSHLVYQRFPPHIPTDGVHFMWPNMR
jgi:hypothetical protein